MKSILYTTILVLLFSVQHIHAQSYYFDSYSVKEGLAQSKVYTSFQDSLGNVWLGTPSGVSRFDGIKFTNYTTADSLADGGVQAIFSDGEVIWLGHIGGGISIWDGKRFKELRFPNLKLRGDISDFATDKEGNIWIASVGAGAIRIHKIFGNNLKATQYRGKEGLGDRVYKIRKNKTGDLLFIIDGSIKQYQADDNSFHFYRPEGLSFFAQFTDMHFDASGNIWFGTYQNGLYRYNPITKETKYFYKRDGLAGNFITAIREDIRGNIWVGTYTGGISCIVGDSIKTFSTENGLVDNEIRSLSFDREGNLLIGTYNHGLLIFRGEQFVFYNKNIGLPSSQVNAILQAQGKIWFGTEKGILVYNPQTKTQKVFTQKDGLLSDKIIQMKPDRDGNIWVVCRNGGVVKYDIQAAKFIEHPRANAAENSEKIRCIEIDQQNNLWVGTWDGVVYYEIDNDAYNFLRQSNGLAGNNIRSIFADSKGRVWFGVVNKGISFVQGTTFSQPKIDSSLSIGNFTPSAFAEDTLGNIWIATEEDGLLLFDGKSVSKQYRTENGLPSNYVASVEVDNNNMVWIGSGAGVNQIDPEGEKIHFYNEKSGFTGIEVRPKASYKDSLGNIWFGTVKGVNVFMAQHERHSTLEPLTTITRLRVNLEEKQFDPNIEIELSHEEYSVVINYSAIWLSNPKMVAYKIMLDGLDRNWQPETRQTEINYPYLKPGSYVFKVMAKNNEGIWNRKPAEIRFTIHPPIWQRPWFVVAMVVVLILLIYLYIFWRERNYRLENLKLEDTVQERTAEIANKNNELAARNRDITDSIRYAKRIQHAVLPSKEAMQNSLPEHFIVFRPRDIVSGDYYWMSKLGNKTIVTAVDCTGHGVPGAFLSMLGVAFLNEIVSKGMATSAADILEHLRRYVIQSLQQSEGEGGPNDGMDMALCIIDPDSKQLEYAGANNPLIFFSNGEPSIIKADKMPIGIYHRRLKSFSNHIINYKEGDTFYIFSDGYPDQFGGENGRKFMRKRFQELLLTIQDKGMAEQGSILEMEFEKWKGSLGQLDDVLVVGVRL